MNRNNAPLSLSTATGIALWVLAIFAIVVTADLSLSGATALAGLAVFPPIVMRRWNQHRPNQMKPAPVRSPL